MGGRQQERVEPTPCVWPHGLPNRAATPCHPLPPQAPAGCGPDPPHLAVQLPQPALQAAARLQVHPHRHAAPLMMMQEVVVVVMVVVQEVV